MSLYYKYNFISPEGIFAIVREEFKSYFDTGAIDDLLFPIYVNKCLSKLGKTTLAIVETPLIIENFSARLPDNYAGVKEAWATSSESLRPYRDAGAFYSQASSVDTIQVSPIITNCIPDTECTGNLGVDGSCMPEYMSTVYKTTTEHTRSYRRTYLLRPGNISTGQECITGYTGQLNIYGQENIMNNYSSFVPYSSTIDSFDIRGNKFITNFRNGIVHLIFYSNNYDNIGNQMIPDDFRISEYIEAFLKYKIFETLTNQTNDETFNQLQQKLQMYKVMSEEAYIMASIESKKQTIWTKQDRVKQSLKRFNKYALSTGTVRRRNNY